MYPMKKDKLEAIERVIRGSAVKAGIFVEE